MKKVENIRLKLNDIRSDLKKFNHDILIQRNMLNKKAETTVSINVPLNNKMRDEELSKTTDEINLAYNVNRHYGD